MEVEVGKLIKKAKLIRCGDREYPVLSMTMHDGLMFQNDRFKKQIASVDQSQYQVVYRHQLVESFPIDEGVLAVQELTDAGIVSPAYKIWDVDLDKVVPKYLELALRAPRSIEYYKSKLRGTTARRRSIPDTELCAMKINYPSLEEQEKIVELVKKTKHVVDTRRLELSVLDDLIKARFVELFGDTVTNPLGWEEHRLDEYIIFLTSGSRGWAQYFVDEENELFITIKNVKNNHITLDNIQYIEAPNNKEAERTKVKSGDLLISITADLGRTGVVDDNIAEKGAYINQHLSLVRLDRMRINPLYVSYFLETEGGKMQFESKNQNGVKAGLNFEAIKSLKILVPPMEMQEAYLDFVKQVDKSKFVA